MSTPKFSSIVDLGLRDVGVANQPRRLLAHFGGRLAPLLAAAVVYAFVACVLITSTGVTPLLVVLAWPAIMLVPVLRMVTRAPVVVVKATADGRNQATWILIAPLVLVVAMTMIVRRDAPTLVPAGLTAVTVLVLWRARGRVPEALRILKSRLEAGEVVLGDAAGLPKPRTNRRDAFRVVAATDRRLIAVGRDGVVFDAPYAGVDRFAIAWAAGGRTGRLSLSAGDATHVIASIGSANLLSLAQALRAQGVPTDDSAAIDEAQRGWEEALGRAASRRPARPNRLNALRLTRIAGILLACVAGLVVTASATGYDLTIVPVAVQQLTGDTLPTDGRSDLTGGAASLRYTPGPGLRELRTDEHWGEAPDDGARWELRTSFTRGYNVISLSHFVFVPRLDDPAAVGAFVAGKDREQSRLAGVPVRHGERVVDGRTGYVWQYRSHRGYRQYAAWFPQPVHSVRVECIAKKDAARFERLCAEAMASLRFRR
ncbi:MAG TPA: hypothetical protein VFN44_25975 [Solirubrobacteraceae bacterium]|nr:hypothetical protein [Solirubrobacteraceae bacterium]